MQDMRICRTDRALRGFQNTAVICEKNRSSVLGCKRWRLCFLIYFLEFLMQKAILRPLQIAGVLAVVGVLAACKPSPPIEIEVPLQATPVEEASVAVETVNGLNGDAVVVAESAVVAANPVSPDGLASLQQYVGTYPGDGPASFLEQGVLAERLKPLLGADYADFLLNMRTVGPLTQDGTVWFITGNRPHEGGMEEAAVVIDAPQNAIRVWMLHDGKVKEWMTPVGAQVPWPKDVQTMVDNQKSQP